MQTPLSLPDAGRVAPISGSVLQQRFAVAFYACVWYLKLFGLLCFT